MLKDEKGEEEEQAEEGGEEEQAEEGGGEEEETVGIAAVGVLDPVLQSAREKERLLLAACRKEPVACCCSGEGEEEARGASKAVLWQRNGCPVSGNGWVFSRRP